MRKTFTVFLIILLFLTGLSGCRLARSDNTTKTAPAPKDTVSGTATQTGSKDFGQKPVSRKKLTIIATLFPQYDFARELAGEKAEIKLLLPPGMESHSYEPTPGDIITIQNSDIFLYTGDDMEPWVSGIVENLGDAPIVANLSDGISLQKEEEENHHHSETEAHHHLYNPHIWTSPVLAAKMVQNIETALIKADPDNKEFYQENSLRYQEKLKHLDQEFREIASNTKHRKIYIGSRFSLLYFMEEYHFSYIAAYDSCEEEAEPSIKRVMSMIGDMKQNHVKAVYYEELTKPYIADTIAEAADAKALLFHSCHNVSKEEFTSGATYLSLMEQNVKNLKKGLEE